MMCIECCVVIIAASLPTKKMSNDIEILIFVLCYVTQPLLVHGNIDLVGL